MLRVGLQACLLVLLAAPVFPGEVQEAPNAEYDSLIERLKKGDAKVDFRRLREVYAASSKYSPPEADLETRRALYQALNSKRYNEAIKIGERVTKENYLDIEGHHILSVAYRESNDRVRADFHRAVAGGLINAILKSGDGKSPQTAMVILATREEYIILSVLSLTPRSQNLLVKSGHNYDVMNAVNPITNQAVTLYFNIDKPYGYMNKVVSRGAK